MRIKEFILLILILLPVLSYPQQGLKNKSDTLFLLDLVKYPQMNVELTISFVKEDFEFNKAISTLSEADKLRSELKGDLTDAEKYKRMAEIFSDNDKLEEAKKAKDNAKELYLKRLSANSSDSEALKYLAKYFMEQGQWNLSKAYYNELTLKFPDDEAGWEGIGLVEMVNLNVENAYKNMSKAIDKSPGNISLYCSMANIVMYKAFSDLTKLPDSIIMKRKFDQMIDFDFIKKAMKLYPENENFKMINQGLEVGCLMIEVFIKNRDVLGNYSDTSRFALTEEIRTQLNKSEEYFTKALSTKYKQKKFPYECLMIIEFLKNDGERSVKYFDQGIKNTKGSKELYSTMVAIYAFLWKKDECLQAQLKLNKADSSVTNCLLTAYFFFALDKFSDAKIWTRKVLAVEKTNSKALLGMTAIAIREKNLPEAQINILKYEKSNPQTEEYLFYKAVFYLLNNSPQIAKNSLDYLANGNYFRESSRKILERFYK